MAFSTRRRPSRLPEEAPADPYGRALMWLGRRDLTERQIRTRLADVGCGPDAIEVTVERLRRVCAIDDTRVAGAIARTAGIVKGRGRLRVARELVALGIDRTQVAATLDAVLPVDGEGERLDRALDRRAGRCDLGDAGQRRKVMASLLRQGFEGDAIRAAIRRRASGAEDEDA